MALHVEADLPPGAACLKNVDALLRCPICFDFLNISMMTKCSHNFCSLCIRKCLCYKMQCPVCNAQATEQDLRTNRLLDELVVNFHAVRQQLSKANFDSPPISQKTPASAVKCSTPRERVQNCKSTVLSNFFHKRPKTSAAKETRQGDCDSQSTRRGKTQTVRADNANYAVPHSANAQLPVVVKEEPNDDEDESSFQHLMSVKQEAAVSYSISTGDETAHSSSLLKDVKPVIKVECPVCSISVPQQFVNKHLDTCLTRGERKESMRSSVCSTRRPMVKVVYNLLSMQELRRRLKEGHLSVRGSRDQLIKRHQEFVQIYNAQCDSLNPKSAEDIAKDVEANEKIRNQLRTKTKPVMVFSKNPSEKEIDDVHSSYRKRHSSDFSRLIAQVRGRLETTRQTPIKQEVIVDEEEDAQGKKAAESINGSVVKVEDGESDEVPSARGMECPSSPTHSDVSISSSISDIFGPEPVRNPQGTERTTGQKRASITREDDAASSLVSGKRRRKTTM